MVKQYRYPEDTDAPPDSQLSISDSGKHLAFSSDSGTVGTVDLSTRQVTRMKSRHTTVGTGMSAVATCLDSIERVQVCGSVKCIPDRPSEIVSGGYDSAILHFDIGQGSILSRFDIGKCTATSRRMPSSETHF